MRERRFIDLYFMRVWNYAFFIFNVLAWSWGGTFAWINFIWIVFYPYIIKVNYDTIQMRRETNEMIRFANRMTALIENRQSGYAGRN